METCVTMQVQRGEDQDDTERLHCCHSSSTSTYAQLHSVGTRLSNQVNTMVPKVRRHVTLLFVIIYNIIYYFILICFVLFDKKLQFWIDYSV